MNFFEGINTQQDTFETGGSFDLIPKNTRVVATCEEAKNDSYNDESYINLKWRVNLPKEYANRVVFQKLKVYTADKQQKAREMLAAIATNAGGRLFQAMQAGKEEMTSDESLQTLCNSPMVLLLDVWEIEDKKGNWVRSVAPYLAKAPQPAAQPAPVVAPVVAPAPAPQPTLDDIPF